MQADVDVDMLSFNLSAVCFRPSILKHLLSRVILKMGGIVRHKGGQDQESSLGRGSSFVPGLVKKSSNSSNHCETGKR